MTITRDYPATAYTFVVVHRSESQPERITNAELWSGFGDWDDNKFLLDVFHDDGGMVDGTYGYDIVEDTFEVDGKMVTFPGQKDPAELVLSWITNPPSEPTKRVDNFYAWQRHIDMEIDIMRGK